LIAAGQITTAASDLAARLLAYFGSLAAVLAASEAEIAHAVPWNEQAVGKLVASVRAVWVHSLRQRLASRPLLADAGAVIDYLSARLAAAPVEEFLVLFLDAGNGLIADHLFGSGTPSQVTIYPRQIMARALNLGADGLILVHNHPSGDANPSRSDIVTTRRIAEAAHHLDIRVHDHVIISRFGSTSLRTLGLL
jgi:DNA repair protein RadC